MKLLVMTTKLSHRIAGDGGRCEPNFFNKSRCDTNFPCCSGIAATLFPAAQMQENFVGPRVLNLKVALRNESVAN
jgi:hypothetical protein